MRNVAISRRLIGATALALVMALTPALAAAADGDPEHEHTGEEEQYVLDAASSAPGATFFNESSGCGETSGAMTPATTTNSSSNRSIPSNHQVRGPWGDFFGRDYGDVSGSMVEWTVPMSGGRKVLVHERAYPAFQQVSRNLAARQAEGKYYNVRIAASWVWRRISGSYRMSTHAFGTTIDINWDTNLYSADNVLTTDMPQWFVQAWRDAGFCWGGDWLYIKDSMHFSWMGPAATPGYGSLAAPYPPNTAKAAFTDIAFSGSTGFGNASGGDFVVADLNGDGAPDLTRIRDYGANGIQLSFARSSKNFRRCGTTSYTAYGAQGADEYIVADYDGDSRPDLWAIDTGGGHVAIDVFTYHSGYRQSQHITTGAIPRPGASYLAGDYDRDGHVDLIVVTPGTDTRVEVWSGPGGFASRAVDANADLDTTGRWQFSVGDGDVDGRDDVVAIDTSGAVTLRTLLAKKGYASGAVTSTTAATAASGDSFAMADLDGDGRQDLWQIAANGDLEVRRGGNSTLPVAYWYQTPGWTCTGLEPANRWDFNGDSFGDIALASPGEDIDAIADAGAVNVIFGSKDGPTVAGNVLFYQDQSAFEGLSEKGDRFGGAVASGDFDHDGYADIAIAAPRDDVGTIVDGGLVNVLMGSRAGIATSGGQLWHRDVAGVQGSVGRGDRFGSAMATGDFDGDGFYDLAIGAPGAKVGGADGAGSVSVLYGTKRGLRAGRDQLWHQNSAGILGSPGANDRFGAALAVADFDRDGFDDLAIGVPGDTVGDAAGAGQVQIIYGSGNGLTAAGNARFHQDSPSVPEVAGERDHFGSALAAADFDGDGYADLAVGVPHEDSGPAKSIGKVHVLFGGTGGVSAAGSELWSQDSPGVGSASQRGDRFGTALAAGDFDDDGFADLAVGVPGEDVSGENGAGAINLLYGAAGGLQARAPTLMRAGKAGLIGTSEAGDHFGAALRAVDVDGNHRWDLIVGIPGEDLGVVDAGAAILIMAGPGGLKAATGSVWHQGSTGVEGTIEPGDGFGRM